MNTPIRPTLHLKREYAPKHTFYLKRRSRRSTALRSDDFIRRVDASAPQHDRALSRAATYATLELLGQYLSPPEVRRMTARLPRELAEATGRSAGDGGPADMEGFYAQVAAKAGLAPKHAADYVRSIAGVLRQTIPEGELADALLKLPPEFDDLMS